MIVTNCHDAYFSLMENNPSLFAASPIFPIVTDKQIATTMLSELNVDVHFALPYNAQTKPIERDFRKIKEELSKHSRGYRGGNVVERPEKLAKEIKEGKLLIFEQLKAIFDDYVINCLNKKCSMGKNLQGLSPDELFNQECTEIIKPSNDALKLFCMRTSRDFSIGRNGISDKQLGITYWGDWMINCTKLKVYLRRDPENYKVAWAFNSATGEFLGVVNAVRAVAALHADKISKEEFKEAMSIKKRNYKITRSFILHKQEVSLDEHCENYKAAYASVEKSKKPKVSILANTNMDKAIRKNKEMQAQGKYDLSMFLDETPYKEEELFLFETDKLLKEELQGVVNGY